MPVLTGRSPHLRLQSDERLIALVRRGHQGAFEVLLKRYQPRLLAFCRHMLPSNEDAEDVLQEVFASAYNAICLDDRPIKARPWLYRIARNRCLNHLRRPQDAGQESMDVFERDSGVTAADTVHRREEFRQILADVHDLPESQRTALLLREIDTLSYDQIAEAMDTTVPSVKSLLVRARMSLAEASEARQLTCGEVRLQLTQAAEGVAKASTASRRHLRTCNRCRTFRRELRRTSRALAAVYPIGPAVGIKALIGGWSAGAGKGTAGGSGVAGGAALASTGATGALSLVGGSVVAKAAAGLLAAALVTAGALEVQRSGDNRDPEIASGQVSPAPTNEALRPPPPVTGSDTSPRQRDAGPARARPEPPPDPPVAAQESPAAASARSAPADPVGEPPAGTIASDPAVETVAPQAPPAAAPPVVEEPPAAPTTEGVTPPGGYPAVTAPQGGSPDTSGGGVSPPGYSTTVPSGSTTVPSSSATVPSGGGTEAPPETGFAGGG